MNSLVHRLPSGNDSADERGGTPPGRVERRNLILDTNSRAGSSLGPRIGTALAAISWFCVVAPYVGPTLTQDLLPTRALLLLSPILAALARTLNRRSRQIRCDRFTAVGWVLWLALIVLHETLTPHPSGEFRDVTIIALGAVVAGVSMYLLGTMCWTAIPAGTALATLAAVLVLISNYEILVPDTVADATEYRSYRVASPVSLGLIFSMATAIGITRLTATPIRNAFLIAIGIAGSILLLRRANLLTLPVMFLVGLGRWRSRWVPAIAVAIAAMAATYMLSTAAMGAYMSGLTGGQSMSTRLALWTEGLHVIGETRGLGAGLDHWDATAYPHNFLIQSGSDLGALALLAVLLIMFRVIVATRATWRPQATTDIPDQLPTCAVCCVVWIHAMKSGNLMGVDMLLPLSVAATAQVIRPASSTIAPTMSGPLDHR